jgi:hypothetical protein
LALFGWTELTGDARFLGCNLCFSKVFVGSEDDMDLAESHHWYCPWINGGSAIVLNLLVKEDEDGTSSGGNSMSKVLQASMLLKKLLQ